MGRQRFFALKKTALKVLRPYLYEVVRHVFAHRRVPRLAQPVTFNDKVGRRKLYDSNPSYHVVADKAGVRNFVAQRLGSDFLPELYFCGSDVEAIRFEVLPNAFVMKATHGSGPGFISFINEKNSIQKNQLKTTAHDLITQNYGNITNEWWYTQIKPQIIIEEMLKDETYGIPPDYKFFVFHGKVQFIQVDYSRFTNHTRTFYDRDWHPQAFSFKYPTGSTTVRPTLFSQMVNVAEYLGKEFDFIRVDLYCVNDNRVVFGELTLSPEAGWGRFRPAEWDEIIGQLW